MNPLARPGPVACAVAAATDWLIEPAGPVEADRSPAPPEARTVVAVVGLSSRCGATTVGRALGAELAGRDRAGACVVSSTTLGGSVPLGLPAAARLARAVGALFAGRARACGRLCLVDAPDAARLADEVRHLAPLVLDVEDPADASLATALADHVLLVGAPAPEPALASVVAERLARVGPRPIPVLNRAGADSERWAGRAEAELPDSRMGAQLALAGREPRGRLGEAVARLADRCEAVR